MAEDLVAEDVVAEDVDARRVASGRRLTRVNLQSWKVSPRLSNMESNHVPNPADASAALDEALRSRARLAAGLQLPPWFSVSIGLAVAVQILTAAVGPIIHTAASWAALAAGALLFAAVAGAQLARFRRLNGVWIGGLVNRVVLGAAPAASLAYGAGLAGALWAGFAGQWWLSAVCSAAGGAGYVAGSRRWLRRYRSDPRANTPAESLWWIAAMFALAGALLVLLVLER